MSLPFIYFIYSGKNRVAEIKAFSHLAGMILPCDVILMIMESKFPFHVRLLFGLLVGRAEKLHFYAPIGIFVRN